MKFRIIPSAIAITLSLVIGLILGIMASMHNEEGLRVQVEGNFGAPVTVKVSGTISAVPQKMLLIRGDGHLIDDNMQVLFRVSNFAYTKGGYLSTINDAVLKSGTATEKELGDLYPLLKNTPEGSRIMAVFPDKSRANAEIVVIDLLPTINRGELRQLDDLPFGISVTSDSHGVPEVLSDGSKITESQVRVLWSGDGEQIAQGDSIYMNYVMLSADGTLIENTYDDPMPAFVDMNHIFSGLAQVLVDQRVGSRIVVAIPQIEAQGDEDIVMAIDILALAERNDQDSARARDSEDAASVESGKDTKHIINESAQNTKKSLSGQR